MGCGASSPMPIYNLPNERSSLLPTSSTTLNQQLDLNQNPKRDRRRIVVPLDELVQNFLLVWLDEKIDESVDDYGHSIKQLRRTVNKIETFCETDECIEYILQLQNQKILLIISGALCETVVPRVHNMTQLYSIYVFCQKKEKYEEWAKQWSKVKGIFTEIIPVCDAVRQSARQCDEDSVQIGSEIEPSFMYTQLFKEIILTIDFDKTKEVKELVEYARKHPDYVENNAQLKLINKFGEEYGDDNITFEVIDKHDIDEKTLPPNHPALASSYNNIGAVYRNMGEYSKALSSFERSLEIQKIALPANHPDLAASYNNIGMVYDNMGEYSKALSSHERSLEIRTIALPPNHPDLASSYNNIGNVYDNMSEYSKALSSYEQSLEIKKIALPPNHPGLASSYNNIGLVYSNMGEYSKALSSYERSLEIKKIALPPNHPDLAASYNNIGMVYSNMGEYSKALSSYERSLEIEKIALPPNHPDLAHSYNGIGAVNLSCPIQSICYPMIIERFLMINVIDQLFEHHNQNHSTNFNNWLS
ncbi:unnamed protein product [Rotaria sordida]|uniref:Kinesin light chain n=1 Tax=Rotaria sordida TaxID=392033 RepID=A0A816C5E6_9BILA|nr:unnamed protein product [Rotaria sordida]CAF1618983.1 unnamed protein product [Rotaria sordida]